MTVNPFEQPIMNISDLDNVEYCELVSDRCQISGSGSTVATGAVGTGNGYAVAVAYAGAAGQSTATEANVRTSVRPGYSQAQAWASAASYNQGQSSGSSYWGNSIYRGNEKTYSQWTTERSSSWG